MVTDKDSFSQTVGAVKNFHLASGAQPGAEQRSRQPPSTAAAQRFALRLLFFTIIIF